MQTSGDPKSCAVATVHGLARRPRYGDPNALKRTAGILRASGLPSTFEGSRYRLSASSAFAPARHEDIEDIGLCRLSRSGEEVRDGDVWAPADA